ncbi:hypothetical protein Ccrd_020078, partial [Cynara cardunculus var. scolymus]
MVSPQRNTWYVRDRTDSQEIINFQSFPPVFTPARHVVGPQCDPVSVLLRCTRFISLTQKEGRSGKEGALASEFRWHLSFTPLFDCRSGIYVSLSGSLAPLVISFYVMSLSSP